MIRNRTKPHYNFASAIGRTMMETLMVLALYGLLTLSIYKLVGNIFAAQEESSAVVEISKMVDGLHSLYKWGNISSSSTLTPLQLAMREGIIGSSSSSCPETPSACDSSTPVAPVGDSINLTGGYFKTTKNASTGAITETACNSTTVQKCQDPADPPTLVNRPRKNGAYYDCTLTSGDDGYDSTLVAACTAYDKYLTDLAKYQTDAQTAAAACADTLSSCKYVFTLTLTGVTEGQCRKLASTDWGTSFYKATTGGSTTLYADSDNYPFREIDVISLCKNATTINLSFF